jgi:enoyl-[acyl-carrier-protein] reductase (NADH)
MMSFTKLEEKMSELKELAESIDQVVKNMCANPGRSFSRDAHAKQLTDVIKGTKFPKDVADLFVDVTLISTPFTGAHSDDSFAALQELVKKEGKIVDNLLHCIADLKDTEHLLTVMDFTKGPKTKKTKVSFKKQRELAKKELETRGNPEYNVDYYLG